MKNSLGKKLDKMILATLIGMSGYLFVLLSSFFLVSCAFHPDAESPASNPRANTQKNVVGKEVGQVSFQFLTADQDGEEGIGPVIGPADDSSQTPLTEQSRAILDDGTSADFVLSSPLVTPIKVPE